MMSSLYFAWFLFKSRDFPIVSWQLNCLKIRFSVTFGGMTRSVVLANELNGDESTFSCWRQSRCPLLVGMALELVWLPRILKENVGWEVKCVRFLLLKNLLVLHFYFSGWGKDETGLNFSETGKKLLLMKCDIFREICTLGVLTFSYGQFRAARARTFMEYKTAFSRISGKHWPTSMSSPLFFPLFYLINNYCWSRRADSWFADFFSSLPFQGAVGILKSELGHLMKGKNVNSLLDVRLAAVHHSGWLYLLSADCAANPSIYTFLTAICLWRQRDGWETAAIYGGVSTAFRFQELWTVVERA